MVELVKTPDVNVCGLGRCNLENPGSSSNTETVQAPLGSLFFVFVPNNLHDQVDIE